MIGFVRQRQGDGSIEKPALVIVADRRPGVFQFAASHRIGTAQRHVIPAFRRPDIGQSFLSEKAEERRETLLQLAGPPHVGADVGGVDADYVAPPDGRRIAMTFFRRFVFGGEITRKGSLSFATVKRAA